MTYRLRKRFGQNHLQDDLIIRRIPATIHPVAGGYLLEISPGRGPLAAGLLTSAGRLDLVALDRHLIEALARAYGHLAELIILLSDSPPHPAANRRRRSW